MDYSRILPEPKVPQPSYSLQIGGDFLHPSAQPALPPQLYGGVLHLPQQPLSHSPYPTNTTLSNCQTPLRLPDPYPRHGGYIGKAPAAAPCSIPGAVSSAASLYSYSIAMGGAVEGSCGYVGGEAQRMFAAKEAIRQFGGHPLRYVVAPRVANDYGLGPTIPPYSKPPLQNPGKLPKSLQNWKKVLKKTTKVEYSAYCEVCKVDCNSHEVLNSHKQGKKHKKNLQKLQELITPWTTKTVKTAPAKTLEIGANDIETTQFKDAKRRTFILENEVDLETKRNRIIEAGASVEGVRTCTICNVVVNSQKVYEHHLAGQKHAAMVNKLKEAQVGEVQETKDPEPSICF